MKDTDPTPVPPPAEKPKSKAKSIHEMMAEHMAAKRKDDDMTVAEHAARCELAPRVSVHPQTAEKSTKPHWAVEALLACFHAQGIHLQQKMSAEMFDKALDHVLHSAI